MPIAPPAPRLLTRKAHRQFLLNQAVALVDFFQTAAFNPKGGFFILSSEGKPLPPQPQHQGVERQIHDTSRMVHCFAIAHQLGLPGADRTIDHGLDYIWRRHRDLHHGGYFWGVDDAGATNPSKQAYGHAFVLLAGASAKVVGHPDADRLIGDVTEILHKRFWQKDFGAAVDECSADWSTTNPYRGQNANMHLAEATMAAFEATGDKTYLEMAIRIAALIINRHARAQSWRVAEHFDAQWTVDRAYEGDPMFRPRGHTPGHALEWSRLLVQMWQLAGQCHAWMIEAAKALFLNTVKIGWDHGQGGFFYTLDWQDKPDQAERFWWPCAEGIGAAAVLGQVDDDPQFEEWYARIWGFVRNHVIDEKHGGWHPELDAHLHPVSRVFVGKPDIYHALQACVIPLVPATGSLTKGLTDPQVLAAL
ncbi:MAG: AGE family epimerase/isomerase [Alphaproteobacteria bacterium]|nr:AGE family epimerase/isomerase [Alphaproteobacteria bacterium]